MISFLIGLFHAVPRLPISCLSSLINGTFDRLALQLKNVPLTPFSFYDRLFCNIQRWLVNATYNNENLLAECVILPLPNELFISRIWRLYWPKRSNLQVL